MKNISAPSCRSFLTIAVCGALFLSTGLPEARAVCQQGCGVGNDNTFLGDNASNTGGGNTAIGSATLFSNTSGSANTASGSFALQNNTTGIANTASGSFALRNNTTGSFNTSSGFEALQNNTTADDNTATGSFALLNNTTGSNNTANGRNALFLNTTGSNNTANGRNALQNYTAGSNNTATGAGALGNMDQFNTGSNNTANGFNALFKNSTGSNNLANGFQALMSNTTGVNNMATGTNALFSSTTGFFNMANGSSAMFRNTTGNYNVAEGLNALYSNTTGSNNIAIGINSGGDLTTGSGNIDIGNRGIAGESRNIRIGTKGSQTNTFIVGISGVTVAGGVGVIVDTNGHLGTVVSSKRFKEEIKPMDKASEAILSLEPVTFRYKHELDPNEIPQFGLVAEEVEKVNPDLVARDERGKAYTVRYEAVNAMLLNEFLKEHRKVAEEGRKMQEQELNLGHVKSIVARQETTIAQQQKEIQTLMVRLNEQASQIQKVSEQLQLQKPVTQIAAINE